MDTDPWWAEISGNVREDEKSSYPKGEIETPGRIDLLLEKYPNMYADLSAHSGYNALSRDTAFAKRFLMKHYRKLLFGTDRFVREDKEKLIIDLLKKMELPSDVEERIFATNAERMLNL